MSATSLISFEDGNLVLNTTLPLIQPLKTRILSIIGKARMGKSTFLNAFATYLNRENIAPFAARDDIEHCTRGVDYYYIEDQNILLLDCQGLAWEDSQNDHKLLLLIYSISDMIIFNERMMLQNETLKLLEPICTFLHYIDRREEDELPHLYFRISDGGVVKSPKHNLEKLLASHKDAYQTIRESIQQLFHEGIGAVKTDGLTETLSSHLESGDYASVIKTDECGFRTAIETILTACPKERRESPITQIPRTIAQINGNEKITIEKLDIVKLTSENDIRQWKDENVPAEMYASIPVDGTQKAYEDKVESRKRIKTNILSAFTRRFRSVPDSIKRPFYEDLSARMNEPIQKATQETQQLAETTVKPHVVLASEQTRLAHISSAGTVSFLSLSSDYVTQITPRLTTLETVCQPLFTPVRERYMYWIQQMRRTITSAIETIQAEETEIQTKIQTTCNELGDSFESWAKERPLSTNFYRMRNSLLVNTLIQSCVYTASKKAHSLLKSYSLTVDMTCGTHESRISIDVQPNEFPYSETLIMTYDLTCDILTALKQRLHDMVAAGSSMLVAHLIAEKEAFLRNKDIHSYDIITANPEIEFIIFSGTDKWRPDVQRYITRNTFIDVFYKEVYEPVKRILVEDGVCVESHIDALIIEEKRENITTLRYDVVPGNGFRAHLSKLWNDAAIRVFCKAYTAGKIPLMIALT